jgi:hypothetical protein
VPPPYASFVSYQLQKYLETINVEQTEYPTGSVKMGAVLFSDASGFTAMTQRLAVKVYILLLRSDALLSRCVYR